jgi:hypothetical protein
MCEVDGAMAEQASAKIPVVCSSCGTRLLAPAWAVGKRGKCFKCGHEVIITRSSTPVPAAAVAAARSVNATPRTIASAQRIPPPIPSSSTTTTPLPDPSAGGVVILEEERLKPGTMWAGATLAAMASAAGAGAWLAIAWYTGSELSLTAWAVGMASGVGMLIGRHRASHREGLVAALFAAAGVVAGKILVFLYVKAPLLIVLALLTTQQLEKDGIDPARATPTERAYAANKAQAGVRAMDSMARRAQIRTVVEARQRQGGVFGELSTRRRINLFFRTMFTIPNLEDPNSWLDFVAIVLAVGTAFKLGTFGGAGGT